MKLETFVTNYVTDGSPEKYIKSHIVKDYVSYVTKCDDCERIARSCHYKDVDGKRRFSTNTPAKAMMFVLLLVDRYTKIDVEYSVEAYDALQKCGAVEAIMSAIPENELQEYSAIMRMVEDDLMLEETNVAARMDDFKQAVFAMLDVSMRAYEELENETVLEATRGDS